MVAIYVAEGPRLIGSSQAEKIEREEGGSRPEGWRIEGGEAQGIGQYQGREEARAGANMDQVETGEGADRDQVGAVAGAREIWKVQEQREIK